MSSRSLWLRMMRRNRLQGNRPRQHTFRVADFRLEIVFDGTNDGDNIGLLPSFVPFIAESGTGKSTHSGLWLKNIPDTHLLNDDNPILRIVSDTVMIYGSPWSGKTPCYRQEKYPAGAVVKISRAPVNSIERMNVVRAFAAMLPACSTMKADERLHGLLCQTIGKVISHIPVYTMHCLPDDEAAMICHRQVSKI